MAKANILTRLELAEELGTSARTVDRLIAAGLAPAGKRGNAKLYDPAAAAKLWDAVRQKDPESTSVIVESWHARTEDLVDRHRALIETWIADQEWRPLWAEVVEFARRWFIESPGLLRVMVRMRDPWQGERALRPLLDSLRDQMEQRVERIVAVDRETLPPRPGAVLGERLVSLTPIDGGPRPDVDQSEFERIVASMTRAEGEAVDEYFDDRSGPMTSADARQAWLAARAAYTRQRIAVRHDHRKREDLRRKLVDATWWFWSTMLNGWLNRPFDTDADTTQRAAESLLRDALGRLAGVDGAADVTELITRGAT